ncbi:MAG: preprotein translocase subunit SecG [Chthonomonas sp.]|nr:preprotein translocase subunit SecG [Chthonomonas sp.]
MATFYQITQGLSITVAIVFVVLVLITAKGDAMSSGGGAVRTTFKGKASIDDQISRLTMILGGAFMFLMVLLEAISSRLF